MKQAEATSISTPKNTDALRKAWSLGAALWHINTKVENAVVVTPRTRDQIATTRAALATMTQVWGWEQRYCGHRSTDTAVYKCHLPGQKIMEATVTAAPSINGRARYIEEVVFEVVEA